VPDLSSAKTLELFRRVEQRVASADLLRWRQIARILWEEGAGAASAEEAESVLARARADLRRIVFELVKRRPHDALVVELDRRVRGSLEGPVAGSADPR
jgi:hypothetical protein